MAEQKDKPVKVAGRYRKVEVRTWGDAKFRELSPIPPCGQGLWLFLITGPHTGPIPGLFRAGRAAMAEELGWEIEAFDKAFGEAFRQGMVQADFKARVMWVPNAIKHNKPESPNVVRSWASEFDLIPECDLKWLAFESLKSSIHALGEPFGKAFEETFPKPSGKPLAKPTLKTSPNQEQEQEQDSSVPKGTGDLAGLIPETTPDPIFGDGLAYLVKTGVPEKGARSFLGKMRKALNDDLVAVELIVKAQQLEVSDPVPWLRAAAQKRLSTGRVGSTGVAL
jgi:hypothetical protein